MKKSRVLHFGVLPSVWNVCLRGVFVAGIVLGGAHGRADESFWPGKGFFSLALPRLSGPCARNLSQAVGNASGPARFRVLEAYNLHDPLVSENGVLDVAVWALLRPSQTGRTVLMARRKDTNSFAMIGGKLNSGESILEAGLRELTEEVGPLEVGAPKLVAMHIRQAPSGLGTSASSPAWIRVFVIQAEWKAGEAQLREPHKMSELGWYPLEKVPEPIHEAAAWHKLVFVLR